MQECVNVSKLSFTCCSTNMHLYTFENMLTIYEAIPFIESQILEQNFDVLVGSQSNKMIFFDGKSKNMPLLVQCFYIKDFCIWEKNDNKGCFIIVEFSDEKEEE